MSKNIRALPSLLRLSLGSDVPHPDTTGKVPLPAPAPPTSRVRRGAYAFPWPDSLPGLGSRRVGPFTDCFDCLEASAWPIRVAEVRTSEEGRVHVTLPGDRGTWVTYGDRPLCLGCARRRAAP